jgi:hypothetical protein
MGKVIKITRWALAVLLSIISLFSVLSGDVIFGLIILSISLILLPPISQKLFHKKKENERTLFGKIVKYLFIGFNVIYVIWGLYTLRKFLLSNTTENLEEFLWLFLWTIIPIILIWLFWNLVLGLLTFLTIPTKKNQIS